MTLAKQVQERFALANQAYPQGELEFMCGAVQSAQPQAIFEWGTGSGASGRIFAEALSILGLAALVHTTDLPDALAPLEEQHPRERTGQYLTANAIRKRGDGVTESLVAWTELRPERSLWFIDGDHSLYAVYREVALIERMVPDAVMLIHDTNSGPGEAAEKWVADPRRHHYSWLEGRTGIGLLEPL